MATRINGGVSQQGKGTSVCTYTGGTLMQPDLKLGPDGDNWDILDANEIGTLFNGTGTFRHVAKSPIDHLCAGKGRWAFTVFASTNPLGVVFLHIRPPKKLDAVMGSSPNIYSYSCKEMWTAYQYAVAGTRAPRVWRRNVDNWDEIAINFCVKNG